MLSVCPSVCLSRPSVHPVPPPSPREKTKRPTYTKLGRKGPWDTSTPGPITRSRSQRSRSRRLIALFAKNPHNFAACCPINFLAALPRVPSLPWQRPFPPSVRTQLQGRPHSGRPLNGRTLLFLMLTFRQPLLLFFERFPSAGRKSLRLQCYGAPSTMWDHTALPATRHR